MAKTIDLTEVRLDDGSNAGVWTLDAERSSVRFRVGFLWGLMRIKGGFGRYRGQVLVDEGGVVSGRMSIDAASVDTGIEQRDAHLRSTDFFDAARCPTITFTARRVMQRTADRVSVVGDLTVSGHTERVEFEALVARIAEDRISVSANIAIDRTQFGMDWSPFGIAKRRVVVTVSGMLVRAASHPE